MSLHEVGTQPLTTARLRLRRLSTDDTDSMFDNWASDPEVTKFLTWPAYTDRAALREYLSDGMDRYADASQYHWGIELVDDRTLIGTIGVTGGDDSVEMKEVGYCIGQQWWGLGYTAEALMAVIEYLFEQVGVNRIEAIHDPRNPASGRVMAKCGMRYEGVLRQRGRSNLGIVDTCMWAILAEDRPPYQ